MRADRLHVVECDFNTVGFFGSLLDRLDEQKRVVEATMQRCAARVVQDGGVAASPAGNTLARRTVVNESLGVQYQFAQDFSTQVLPHVCPIDHSAALDLTRNDAIAHGLDASLSAASTQQVAASSSFLLDPVLDELDLLHTTVRDSDLNLTADRSASDAVDFASVDDGMQLEDVELETRRETIFKALAASDGDNPVVPSLQRSAARYQATLQRLRARSTSLDTPAVPIGARLQDDAENMDAADIHERITTLMDYVRQERDAAAASSPRVARRRRPRLRRRAPRRY